MEDMNGHLTKSLVIDNVSFDCQDAPILDQLLSTNPHNIWLSTDGAGVVNFGPFCKLATSSRIPVNLFVQVLQLIVATILVKLHNLIHGHNNLGLE